MLAMRFVWFNRGVRKFVAEVEKKLQVPYYIQVHRGFLGLRYLVIAQQRIKEGL